MTRRTRLAVAVAALAFAVPGRADDPKLPARNTSAEALGLVAAGFQKMLDKHGVTEAAGGDFKGAGEIVGTAGANLKRVMARALAAAEVRVSPKARYVVEGTFDVVEDDAKRQLVRVSAVLKDAATEVALGTLAVAVKNEVEVGEILGLTVEYPAGATPGERLLALKSAVDDRPKPSVKDGVVRASADGRFGVEVLVKRGGKWVPVEPKAEKGEAVAPLRRDDVYAVRLVNDADFEAAVAVRIDGLSVFAASSDTDTKTGLPVYQHLLVPKGRAVVVEGWHAGGNDWNEFLVTSFDKSLAKELKSPGKVGTITASFHAAWKKGDAPPAGEPKTADEYAQSADATGKGNRFVQEVKPEERQLGALRGTISVRYNR